LLVISQPINESTVQELIFCWLLKERATEEDSFDVRNNPRKIKEVGVVAKVSARMGQNQ
jgi:hypothetical protein